MGAIPIQEITIPNIAASRPLNIFPLDIVTTSTIAQKHRLKISQGPSFTAYLAMIGQNSMATITLKKVPRKVDNIPTPSALEAFPFFAIG